MVTSAPAATFSNESEKELTLTLPSGMPAGREIWGGWNDSPVHSMLRSPRNGVRSK